MRQGTCELWRISKKGNVLPALLYRLPSKYFRGPLYGHECTVDTVQKTETGRDGFPHSKTAPDMNFGCSCARTAEVVTSAWFAFYLKALLHLAMDVTPACETPSDEYLKCSVKKSHFRVQWLFWSCPSGKPWNMCSCKACLFNQFTHFQLLTLLLCMLLFSCIKCIEQASGR